MSETDSNDWAQPGAEGLLVTTHFAKTNRVVRVTVNRVLKRDVVLDSPQGEIRVHRETLEEPRRDVWATTRTKLYHPQSEEARQALREARVLRADHNVWSAWEEYRKDRALEKAERLRDVATDLVTALEALKG